VYKTKSLAAYVVVLPVHVGCSLTEEIVRGSISFGKEEAKSVMDELNSNESWRVIALGSPHLGSYEIGFNVQI
jgi:hypothetical protein